MIGKLTGIIDSFTGTFLILDVQGVGYQIYAGTRTLSRIGQPGDPASLLIDTHVREDAITLYGFADTGEQEWFRLLCSVQGVGAKVALAILAACPPEKLAVAIAAEDKALIRQADGVGPKLAARILTELKDKAGKIALTPQIQSVPKRNQNADSPAAPSSDVNLDAVSALVNLGYARSEAYTAVMRAQSKANDNDKSTLQSILKLALKELGT